MSSLQAVTNEDFEQSVIQADTPVLVDFYADWCGPCKTQAPILGQLAEELRWEGQIRKSRYRCRWKQGPGGKIWCLVCTYPYTLQ